MKKFLSVVAFFVFWQLTPAQLPTLKLFSNYHSIGYSIKLPAAFDTDTNATVFVRYYSASHPLDTGFAPYRLKQDTFNEFRGSLFMLKPNTKYHVQITLTDSTPSLQTFTFYDSVLTRSEPTIQPTSNIKYVSPTGSGNAYTLSNPGNLATLINNNLVTCGTTVMLLDGVYDVGEMTLNISSDCSPQTPIVIMAAPGANPVLDGGYHQQLAWTQHQFDPNLYEATLPGNCAYTTLCLLDSLRLYPYAGINSSNTIPTIYPMQNLDYGLSGFCRDGNIIRIKTLDGKNPSQHHVILSKRQWCLLVNGANRNSYLQFKGIGFRYYNKPFVYSSESFPAFTLEFRDANFVIIDSCRFDYSNNPILFNGKSNYNTIQNCSFNDQTGLWGHEAFKETGKPDNGTLFYTTAFNSYKTSLGRNLENFGISILPYNTKAVGNVIKGCVVNGIVVGISTGQVSNVMVNEETDIYNNTVTNCYDGLDNLNGQINLRIWNNEISHALVGLSFIAGKFGPRYVFRNLVHHILDRKNPSMDANRIRFVDCNGTISDKIWGTGVKMNAGGNSPHPGSLFLMHNTFHATDTLGFAMYLWKADWRKLYSRNNIYYNEGKSTFFFDDVANENKYSFNAMHDNCFNASAALATVQPVNGQPLCHIYSTAAQLDTGLRNVTGASDVQIKNSLNANPQFKVPGSNFWLQCTSPMIDNGTILHGINNRNFYGAKPDIGAFEFFKTVDSSTTITTVQQTDTVYYVATTGEKFTEYVYDTIYTNINQLTYDTTTNVDCVWMPTNYKLKDTFYTTSKLDTINGCETITLQTVITNNTFTTLNVYDTTVCDTLITYRTIVKVNVVSVPNSSTQSNITFHPNPAQHTVWLTGDLSGLKFVELINSVGEKISISLHGNEIRLDYVAEGVYVLQINSVPIGKIVVLK